MLGHPAPAKRMRRVMERNKDHFSAGSAQENAQLSGAWEPEHASPQC